MTSAATEQRQRASSVLQKELDQHTSIRETLETELAGATEERDRALNSGDTNLGVRMESRLLALQGLSDQEDRIISRLKGELALEEARAAEENTLDGLVSLANDGVREQQAREQLEQELNRLLVKQLPKILDHIVAVQEARNGFIAKAREIGVNMGTDPLASDWVRKLEERGADLSVVLARWVGTPLTISERNYQMPVIQPYGTIIPQLVGIAASQRAHEVRHAEESVRYGENPQLEKRR